MKTGSLFFRLMLIYGLTFMGIAAAIYVPKIGDRPYQSLFKTNVSKYVELLAKEIGSPPDLEAARRLHQETQVLIAVEGPRGWEYFPSQEKFEKERKFFKRHRTFEFQNQGTRMKFRSPHFKHNRGPLDLVSLGLILLVVMISYHWVRRTFRPLQEIGRIADAVSEGNFRVRIQDHGAGEIGRISRAMNAMTSQLSDRFESLRELLRAVSHEVRTPLTRMRIAIESVQNAKIKDSLVFDIQQLDELTFTLLEQERIRDPASGLHLEEMDLSQLTRDGLKPFSEKTLKVDIEDGIMSKIDRARYLLALRNLLKNAFRHGDGKEVKLSLKQGPDGIALTVSDQGPGMSEEMLARIGAPFLRADSSRERNTGGFGLGLSLVHSVIKAHGGTLTAKNTHPGVSISLVFRVSA